MIFLLLVRPSTPEYLYGCDHLGPEAFEEQPPGSVCWIPVQLVVGVTPTLKPVSIGGNHENL